MFQKYSVESIWTCTSTKLLVAAVSTYDVINNVMTSYCNFNPNLTPGTIDYISVTSLITL